MLGCNRLTGIVITLAAFAIAGVIGQVGCASAPVSGAGLFIHQNAAGADCRSCHPDLKVDQKPAMHDDRFLRRHASYAHDPTCAFCHGRNACASCHPQKKDEPPKALDPRRLIPRR